MYLRVLTHAGFGRSAMKTVRPYVRDRRPERDVVSELFFSKEVSKMVRESPVCLSALPMKGRRDAALHIIFKKKTFSGLRSFVCKITKRRSKKIIPFWHTC